MLALAVLCSPFAWQDPAAAPPPLAPGDAAPAWSFDDWLLPGAAAESACTVLAFWAPWNPAAISTLPYLSRLSARHRDAALAVVAVTQPDANGTTRALAAEALAALEQEPRFGAVWDESGAAFTNFARASGNAIMPVAVVVDAQRRVAWIGHPLLLDVPVARVLAGTWDPATGPAETLELHQQFLAVSRAAAPRLDAADADAVLAELDAFAARCPERAQDLAEARYHLLVQTGRADEAHFQGLRVVELARAAHDARTLNALAWSIANPDLARADRDLALALYAATCAAQLGRWRDPWTLDTLAAVHWCLGDRARAITIQTEAVAAAAGSGATAEKFSERLRHYQGAR